MYLPIWTLSIFGSEDQPSSLQVKNGVPTNVNRHGSPFNVTVVPTVQFWRRSRPSSKSLQCPLEENFLPYNSSLCEHHPGQDVLYAWTTTGNWQYTEKKFWKNFYLRKKWSQEHIRKRSWQRGWFLLNQTFELFQLKILRFMGGLKAFSLIAYTKVLP